MESESKVIFRDPLLSQKYKEEEQMIVPMEPTTVKMFLRRIGEPSVLFGERDNERRIRLGKLMTFLKPSQMSIVTEGTNFTTLHKSKVCKSGKFFTEASMNIRNIRIWLAKFSINNACSRMSKKISQYEKEVDLSHWFSKDFHFLNDMTEIGDTRPLTCCMFTCDGKHLLTASLSGKLKFWSIPELQPEMTLEAHHERITGIAVHPKAVNDNLEKSIVATSSADRTARIWALDGTLLSTLTGHHEPLCDVIFHPSGRMLVTSSLDETWSIWDLEKAYNLSRQKDSNELRPLYKQEGHHKPVYSVALQHDGSLLSSGGSDAGCKIWDFRTGRSVMTLDGHADAILSLDFSSDGFHLVSGSLDGLCQIWDLRKAKCEYTLPAHTKLVAATKFHPNNRNLLLTAGYDRQARIWSHKHRRLLQKLLGHGDKVTDIDVNIINCNKIVTTTFDCHVHMWQQSKRS